MTVSDDLHLRCAGEFHVSLDDHIGIFGIQLHGVATPAELLAGAKTAKDGSDQLTDGAKQLKDGMAEFDKEAIQKLTSLISDETTGVYDRLVAMKDYAEEYHSFSGSANGEDTGVKFIYRTDAIEKED